VTPNLHCLTVTPFIRVVLDIKSNNPFLPITVSRYFCHKYFTVTAFNPSPAGRHGGGMFVWPCRALLIRPPWGAVAPLQWRSDPATDLSGDTTDTWLRVAACPASIQPFSKQIRTQTAIFFPFTSISNHGGGFVFVFESIIRHRFDCAVIQGSVGPQVRTARRHTQEGRPRRAPSGRPKAPPIIVAPIPAPGQGPQGVRSAPRRSIFSPRVGQIDVSEEISEFLSQ